MKPNPQPQPLSPGQWWREAVSRLGAHLPDFFRALRNFGLKCTAAGASLLAGGELVKEVDSIPVQLQAWVPAIAGYLCAVGLAIAAISQLTCTEPPKR